MKSASMVSSQDRCTALCRVIGTARSEKDLPSYIFLNMPQVLFLSSVRSVQKKATTIHNINTRNYFWLAVMAEKADSHETVRPWQDKDHGLAESSPTTGSPETIHTKPDQPSDSSKSPHTESSQNAGSSKTSHTEPNQTAPASAGSTNNILEDDPFRSETSKILFDGVHALSKCGVDLDLDLPQVRRLYSSVTSIHRRLARDSRATISRKVIITSKPHRCSISSRERLVHSIPNPNYLTKNLCSLAGYGQSHHWVSGVWRAEYWFQPKWFYNYNRWFQSYFPTGKPSLLTY